MTGVVYGLILDSRYWSLDGEQMLRVSHSTKWLDELFELIVGVCHATWNTHCTATNTELAIQRGIFTIVNDNKKKSLRGRRI
jgi:hypothetical protein